MLIMAFIMIPRGVKAVLDKVYHSSNIYVGFQCDPIPQELHVLSDTHFLKPCKIQGVPADTENYYGVRPKDMVNIFFHANQYCFISIIIPCEYFSWGIRQLKVFHPPMRVFLLLPSNCYCAYHSATHSQSFDFLLQAIRNDKIKLCMVLMKFKVEFWRLLCAFASFLWYIVFHPLGNKTWISSFLWVDIFSYLT